jgi:predicted phage tail protein
MEQGRFVAAAVAAPAILGTGAFMAVATAVLYTEGVTLAAMGAALAFYGMYQALIS